MLMMINNSDNILIICLKFLKNKTQQKKNHFINHILKYITYKIYIHKYLKIKVIIIKIEIIYKILKKAT